MERRDNGVDDESVGRVVVPLAGVDAKSGNVSGKQFTEADCLVSKSSVGIGKEGY